MLLLKSFRLLSLLEGLSYLIILGVTFGLISRDYVYVLGLTHGALFTLYLVFSLIVSGIRKWSLWVWLSLFLAAIVPLAFIGVEIFLRREMAKAQ